MSSSLINDHNIIATCVDIVVGTHFNLTVVRRRLRVALSSPIAHRSMSACETAGRWQTQDHRATKTKTKGVRGHGIWTRLDLARI